MAERVTLAVVATGDKLTENTPVDTGRARSNWQVGVNALPQPDNRAPYAPLPTNHYPGGPGAAGNLAEGKFLETANRDAARTQMFAAVKQYRLGDVLYLSNTVSEPLSANGYHYLKFLNAGGSPQVAAGFLERSLAQGRLIARQLGRHFIR
jgi:hypothetical protein